MPLKRASVGIVALAIMLVACGGSSSSGTKTSGIKNRVFVTNAFSGNIQVVDAAKDQLSSTTITAGSQPGMMAVSPGRELTMVFDGATNSITLVNNTTEQSAASIFLPSFTESMIARDANSGFAAVRNANVTGQTDLGAVLVLDLQHASTTATIPIARARRIVLNKAGTRLVVFSDNSNSVSILDVSSGVTAWDCTKGTACTVVGGFDQPVWGVFGADDSTVFVMNCGPECGGTTSSVQALNTSTGTAGTPVPVSAATMGMLNGTTLFVAGTRNALPGQGLLNTLDVSSGTPVPGSVKDVAISDGFHTRMALAGNNKLFIGSINCTNNASSATPTGCLTIFDTSANTAVIDPARGPVTGMVPIANRNAVYVIEGGELRIYDSTTSAQQNAQIDIVGQAVDVKAVDQPQ